jgi:hypothetical protein
MKKRSMRWVVGLLAGGALAMAGCAEATGGNEATGEGRAFDTPQHREDRPTPREAGETRGPSYGHPASRDQESPGGQLPQGSPMGGGTAGPNTGLRPEAAGVLPSRVPTGLGTSLADSYQAPSPGQGGGTATGGSGAAGGAAPPGGSSSNSADQGNASGAGGANSASGGGASGQEGPR